MKRSRVLLFAVWLILLLCSSAAAQLPDPTVDITLGLQARKGLLKDHYVISSTRAARAGHQVFNRLLATSPVMLSSLPFNWDITVLSGSDINAFATSGGQVYVLNGLAEILGERKPLWAAAIGHELAHTARRHQTTAYMRAVALQLQYEQQKAYYKQQAALGDESANWALLGLEIGKVVANIASLRLSREEEHEADHIGMLMMAEAGYHPAYVFALHHTLQAYVGDKSRFGAFFSDHPRWETRAQRSHRFYREALARFQAFWPNPELAPGGFPPPIVFLDKPITSKVKAEGVAVIRIPVTIEEGAGQDIRVHALLLQKGKRITTAVPEYRDQQGSFVAQLTMQAPSEYNFLECPVSQREVKFFASPGMHQLGTTNCGERVTVLEGRTKQSGALGDDWTRIRTATGDEGFVASWFIDKARGSESTHLEFRLPTTALPSNQRKLKSRVCVTTTDGLILDCTKEFKVKFPKLKKQK